MTFITNNRPAPLDMRGIDPAAIYCEVKPTATNAQQIQHKPVAAPVVKRSEFAGYSINATLDEATFDPYAPTP